MSTASPTPRLGGYRRDLEDYQWLSENDTPMFAAPPVDIAALPESAGVASWMQIENQSQIGSCAGHASTSAEELSYYRQTKGGILQLSRMFRYLAAQRIEGTIGDNGSSITGNCKAAQEYGSALESEWPYPGQYPRNGYKSVPAELWNTAKKYLLRSFTKLGSYDECLAWLAHGAGGIAIGVGWNQSCEPDDMGRVTRYRPGGGGHSLALLDWAKKFMGDGKPFLDEFNSWSKEWGYQGRAFIAPAVVDMYCQNEEVYGYSDMVDVKPRPFDWLNERGIS